MRGGAFKAGLIAAAIDLVAMRHAWGSWPERAAVAAGVVALLGGAALLAVPWLRALTATRTLANAVAAVPLALVLGVALSDTHTARVLAARLGDLPVVALFVATLSPMLLALPRLTRLRGGRALLAMLGIALLLLDAWLPARLYPSLRVSCSTIGFVALACALETRRRASIAAVVATNRAAHAPTLAAQSTALSSTDRAAHASTLAAQSAALSSTDRAAHASTLAAQSTALSSTDREAVPRTSAPAPRYGLVAATAIVLLASGHALVAVSTNARFIAHAQAPAAGLVLDGLAWLAPERAEAAATSSDAGEAARTVADKRAATERRTSHATTKERGLDSSPAGASSTAAVSSSVTAASSPARGHDALLGDAHFLLVTVDALRADHLRPSAMPRTAALAARSAVYVHAYAAAPSTASSIASLLTGHAPSHLGAHPPTLADVAHAHGWFTEAFYPAGLFFDGGGALAPYAAARFGFDWADTRTLPAEALTDAVLARLQALQRDHEPRAFLWAHYFDPHEPYERHALPAGAPAAARYDAECAAVDAALARLLNGLTTLARPSLVVVAADHGEEFGEHGGAYHGSSLYEEQLRVPLFFFVVGGTAQPQSLPVRRLLTPVSLVDVAATVAALLDLPLPNGDGVALAPDSGAEPPAHDLHGTVHTHRMLLRDHWKLIHDERGDFDELYDLAADASEQRNLADARRDVTGTLHAALDQWLNQLSTAQLAAILDGGARSATGDTPSPTAMRTNAHTPITSAARAATASDAPAATANDARAATTNDTHAATTTDARTATASDALASTASDARASTTNETYAATTTDARTATASDALASTASDARASTTNDTHAATTTDARRATASDALAATASDALAATASDARASTINDTYAATTTDARTATASDARASTASNARAATTSDARAATTSDARAAKASDARTAKASDARTATAQDSRAATAQDSRAATARAAAARELGAREAYAGAAALRRALDDADADVRAEAALALGQLTDKAASPSLRALLDDATYGARAAIMLGRLRDPTAAPALAALCRRGSPAGDGETSAASERRDAAHYLGFVGDGSATDALLAAAADPRARGSAYVALGRIAGRLHDRAATDALLARFAVEDHADARADLAWALGLAGDARALAPLAAAVAADPPLPRASEALIRLGAVARDAVGGDDLACRRRSVPPPLDAALDEWLGVTSCTVAATPLLLRARAASDADVVIVRARAVAGEARLTLVLDGVAQPPLVFGPRFREVRVLRVRPPVLTPRGRTAMVKPIAIELRSDGPNAPVEVDHLLLVREMTTPRL